jgi:2-dehydropantoate 2-reductase
MIFANMGTLAPDGKTSMLQDVEARRKTEVEILGATVVGSAIATASRSR